MLIKHESSLERQLMQILEVMDKDNQVYVTHMQCQLSNLVFDLSR